MPEIAAHPAEKMEKVEAYLRDNATMKYNVLDRVYRFLKEKKTTHYISAIELGAVVYSLGVKCSKMRAIGGCAGAGVDLVAAEAKTSIKSTKQMLQKTSRRRTIGNIEQVERGKGEGVIGYQLQPIFMLIDEKHEKTKQLLQSAILSYLQEQSESMNEPVIISTDCITIII